MEHMMTTVLCIRRYNEGDEMNLSDQLTVHSRVWEDLHRDHDGFRPLFVEVAELGITGDSPVGRLHPSAGSSSVALDTCIIPEWMWMRLGAPIEMWVSLRPIDLPDAGSIRLRPRDSRVLAILENPLEALTDALSGSMGTPSWACLCTGSELPLSIGTFDILGLESIEGYPVSSACILNLDVNLDLEEAPTPVRRPPTPIPIASPVEMLSPSAEEDAPPGVMWFSGMSAIVGGRKR
jgi:hypothetical protein